MWRTHKTPFGSLTQKFIRYYTFLSSFQEKETEYENWTTGFSRTKRICHEIDGGRREREREREQMCLFFHGLSSNSNTSVLVGFILSTVHLDFNCSLQRLWLVFNSRHYLVESLSQWTFKPESSTNSFWRQREDISISSDFTPAPLFFFSLVIFNYCSHSLVTGWPTTSTLAGLLRGQLTVS